MNIEIRADGVHISGYVNVTEKMSRPVITSKGQKVVEVIEPRAFERAIERTDNLTMTKDHDPGYVLAETRAGNLTVFEDAIGLHADAVVTDENTIAEARAGKIKGWSFGMTNIKDNIEERADSLPLRRVSAFDLDHITLVVNKTPVYAATSVEMRANDEVSEVELRGTDEKWQNSIKVTEIKKQHDNSAYRNRITALSGKKEV